MVEIVEGKQARALIEITEGRKARPAPTGILARQIRAMLSRFDVAQERDSVMEGFCDELQSFLESVPGLRSPVARPSDPPRRRRAA